MLWQPCRRSFLRRTVRFHRGVGNRRPWKILPRRRTDLPSTAHENSRRRTVRDDAVAKTSIADAEEQRHPHHLLWLAQLAPALTSVRRRGKRNGENCGAKRKLDRGHRSLLLKRVRRTTAGRPCAWFDLHDGRGLLPAEQAGEARDRDHAAAAIRSSLSAAGQPPSAPSSAAGRLGSAWPCIPA